MYGIGVDYRQVVSESLDNRLSALEELRDAVHYALTVYKDSGKVIKEEHIDLAGDLEKWVDVLDDEIKEVETEIDEELNSVSASYCD